MLYTISKLRKSRIQRFKPCTIWSWNEEDMAFGRQLHQAMGTPFHKVKIHLAKISHKPGAVVFRRPYLPHFSSKSYTVWSVGFLTSWALKWYIECRKWTSGSAPKVRKKTAAVVLWFPLLHCSFLAYFERLWQRAMELQSLVLHEFELPKALPWTIYSSPSFLDCFGVAKSYQKHQNLTQFD